MKIRLKLILSVLITFLLFSVAFGQVDITKNNIDKWVGDDVLLVKETVSLQNESACKNIVCSFKKEGKYFLFAFVSSPKNKKISVYIDGKKQKSGILSPQADGWQMCELKSKDDNAANPITFSSGEHTITFSNGTGEVPLVEEITLGTTPEDLRIDRKEFFAWYNSLKNNVLPDNFSEKNDKNQLDEKMMQSSATEAMLGDDPKYKYNGYIAQPFTYTYRGKFYIKAGVYTEFYTSNPSPSGTDPVMHLYLESNPGAYSWADDDGGGGRMSRIATSIYVSGYYSLVVRAFSTSSYGTVDIYQNGSRIQAGATVAGNVYWVDASLTSGLKNYFTCNPYRSSYRVPDTYLWIMQGYHTQPIKAWNDDYNQSGGGNYNFGWASRIKSELSDVNWMLVSAYSTSSNGTCDMYGGNNMSNIVGPFPFPELKEDDAIKTADADAAYNCISWSGGRTNLGRYFWPPDPAWPTNLWYDPRGDKQSFDNFYGNINSSGISTPRFSGAITYVPTTNSSESIVDLWATTSTPPHDYTHASVRKPGDNFMHGYDWESKPGGGTRTLHPRTDLRGDAYGNVVEYYKQAGTLLANNYNTENKSGTVEALSSLTYDEAQKINTLISEVSADEKSLFNSYYQGWKNTWNSKELIYLNNPAEFFKSEAYKRLAQYCIKNKATAAVMLIKKCMDGDYLAGKSICEMNLFDNAKAIMEKTRLESPHGQITAEKLFVADTEKSGWTRFIKNLLAENY